MELRNAEKEVDDIRFLYNFIRQHHADLNLPALTIGTTSADSDNNGETGQPIPTDAKSILLALEGIQSKLTELEPKMSKFLARSQDTDPVTSKPRYGPATQARVTTLLEQYAALKQCMAMIFGEEMMDVASPVIENVRQQAQLQDQVEQQQLREEQERVAREEAAKQAEEARVQEEQQRRRREMEELAERERLERARQYEEARLAERQARVASERADREWVESIARGPEGVREQLKILLEATDDDVLAQRIAIKSLHTIFKQITSRPEEVSFRRIRRDHEKFNEDIGRHPGGREILIASGFELGAVDDVPCFISKEPNIEQDMDGWSAWFDLLKATLEIMEEHLSKHGS